jgi:hypothetical protein
MNAFSDFERLCVNQFVKIVPGEGLKKSVMANCLYYSQRLVTAPFLRKRIASLIARVIRARHGTERFVPDTTASHVLQRDGLATLGQLLSAQQCADIHASLVDKSLSGRDAPDGRFTLADRSDAMRVAEYDLVDIINCPHVLALANSEPLLGLAEQYLRCKPTLSSLMLRWSFPADAPIGNVQRFHRDSDDWRYLKVMVYLTDVGELDGPHVYVLGTHEEAAPMRIQVEDDAAIHRRYGKDAAKVVTGLRGTGFAVDTAGIHKGALPIAKPRLMLQMQYSLLPSYANRYVPQLYKGALAFDRYVNRLLVA